VPRSRIAALILLDSSDSLKAPAFDFMLLAVSAIAAALASIQPTTNAAALADAALDPAVVFAVSLYLAMRASSGLASLASGGVMQLYLSYPLSRAQVALSLYLSRILLPVLVLVGAPLAVAATIVPGVVASSIWAYLASYLAYTTYLVFLGTLFALIGLTTKSTGTSAVASLAAYFVYAGVALLFNVMSAARGSLLLHKLAMSMNFYPVVSTALRTPGVALSLWQYLLVPLLLLGLVVAYFSYMKWRFEPP
jgi:ABC-type transport system involved in multi-copper enzyme maturation permease subunit